MSIMYEKILFLCEQRGIKPGKICADTGLSRGMMTDLKMGRTKSLSAKSAKIVADYFDVSVGYLIGAEDAESQKENSPSEENLTEGEKELIELFRQVPKEHQPAVLQVIRSSLTLLSNQ